MIIAAILLASIIAVLAIPLDVIFRIQRQEAFYSDVAVHWLFGIVRFRLPGKTARKRGKRLRDIAKKTKAKATKSNKKPADFSAAKHLFWNARFRYRLFRFVKDMFKSIRIVCFYMRFRLGLDDPADTGRLWAYLGPLAVFLENVSNASVSLEPDFQTESVFLDSSGTLRIVPLQVVFTVLGFLLSPITIGALWTTFQSSKR